MKELLLLSLLFFFTNSVQCNPYGKNTKSSLKNEHPRLILTKANIEAYKIQSTSSKKDLFEHVLKLAEDFCQRPIPEFKDANNIYREIGDGLPSLALAYQLTSNQKFVTCAEKWILAILDTESWHGSQNLGRSSWTMGLTFLYDWLYDELDATLKKELSERLVKEAEIIIDDASYTRALSNHLLIETSAIGVVGLVLEKDHPLKQKFISQADEWAQYIINHAPTDGSWGEGIQYWQYGTGYFLRFLEAAQTADYKNYFNEYNWLKLTGYFPIYFSVPGKLTRVINFSDCGTDRYLPAFLLYLPASKYKNEYFQDYGKKIQSDSFHKFSWLDFLFYDETMAAKDFTSLPHFKHFDDHGFVTMRSGWKGGETVVGFRCGPAPGHRNQKNPDRLKHKGFGPGHQQPDINNFCIYAQNEWLIIDPGYTHKKETRNHNTILVNGYGQAGAGGKWLDYMEFEAREPVPKIIYSESTETFDYVIGNAGNIYVDEANVELFNRHLLFLKPDILVILDDIKLRGKAKIENLLQLNEITQIENTGRNFKLNKNNVEFWIHPVLPKNRTTTLKKRTVKGNDIHGLPNHREGILQTIHIESKDQNVQFLTVVSILNPGVKIQPEVHFQNNTLVIDNNGKKRTLKLSLSTKETNQPLLQLIK